MASVIFDLTCMDVPLLSTQLFIAGLLESGWNFWEGWNNVKLKALTTVYLNCGFTPLSLILIYYFVPVYLRATVNLLYGVFFSGIISYIENALFSELSEKGEL